MRSPASGSRPYALSLGLVRLSTQSPYVLPRRIPTAPSPLPPIALSRPCPCASTARLLPTPRIEQFRRKTHGPRQRTCSLCVRQPPDPPPSSPDPDPEPDRSELPGLALF